MWAHKLTDSLWRFLKHLFALINSVWPFTDGLMMLTCCKQFEKTVITIDNVYILKYINNSTFMIGYPRLVQMGTSLLNTEREVRHVDLNLSVLSPGLLAKGSSAVAGRLCEQ